MCGGRPKQVHTLFRVVVVWRTHRHESVPRVYTEHGVIDLGCGLELVYNEAVRVLSTRRGRGPTWYRHLLPASFFLLPIKAIYTVPGSSLQAGWSISPQICSASIFSRRFRYRPWNLALIFYSMSYPAVDVFFFSPDISIVVFLGIFGS